MKRVIVLFSMLAMPLMLHAQKSEPDPLTVTYKQIDSVTLNLEIYNPPEMDEKTKYPALVFYFGGGWVGGNTGQFKPHAQYFASRGLVCVLVEYRVRQRQHTSPFESLSDAKSAMRYLKAHADELHIDPDRIIASGGSAGGHLAAATALIDGFNDAKDDLSVDPKPAALILFNPVIDNGPGGYGYERIYDLYSAFSPLHNIRKGAPPTIMFLGTEDRLIPVATAKYYKTVMEKVGSRCDLFLYEGQGHGFFNFGNKQMYYNTVLVADKFLTELGFISGSPTLTPPN